MTREEAITRIKDNIEIHRYHERNAVKIFEALDMALKSLEQPEIVRCKDCKWKQGSECVRFAEVRPFPNDFCGRAERKDDETNNI